MANGPNIFQMLLVSFVFVIFKFHCTNYAATTTSCSSCWWIKIIINERRQVTVLSYVSLGAGGGGGAVISYLNWFPTDFVRKSAPATATESRRPDRPIAVNSRLMTRTTTKTGDANRRDISSHLVASGMQAACVSVP